MEMLCHCMRVGGTRGEETWPGGIFGSIQSVWTRILLPELSRDSSVRSTGKQVPMTSLYLGKSCYLHPAIHLSRTRPLPSRSLSYPLGSTSLNAKLDADITRRGPTSKCYPLPTTRTMRCRPSTGPICGEASLRVDQTSSPPTGATRSR